MAAPDPHPAPPSSEAALPSTTGAAPTPAAPNGHHVSKDAGLGAQKEHSAELPQGELLSTHLPHGESPMPKSIQKTLSPATLGLHADNDLPGTNDVAPPIHVSTIFEYTHDPDQLIPARDFDPTAEIPHTYARESTPNLTRLEAVLSTLLRAPCLVYGSGLASLNAAYVFLKPRKVAAYAGYHGVNNVLKLHARLTGLEILPLYTHAATHLDKPLPSAAETAARVEAIIAKLDAGDVVHIETPLNPTGEALDIASYARLAHARGARLVVDSTFAPPSLQDPLALGADLVMHSGTKYLGGHSDLLSGVLATRNQAWIDDLWTQRKVLGSVMGSLEAWLAVRSLRTLTLRVERQAANAQRLVDWLETARTSASKTVGPATNGNDEHSSLVNGHSSSSSSASVIPKIVLRVQHASLQARDGSADASWLRAQMPDGYGPVFALTLTSERAARRLPSKLRLWAHATSLGGVESLVEWRAMSDPTVHPALLRWSVGIEDWRDLRADIEQGLEAVWREERN